MLEAVIQPFIPATVRLYTEKPAGVLLWTNPRVQYNQTDPREPITELEKCQGEGEREIIDMKKALLLCRVALKTLSK